MKSFFSNPSLIPFNPARWPFYYGWFLIFAGAVGVWMSIPGQTIGMSVFIEDLIRFFSLSRSEMSFAYMAGTLLSSFFLTYTGKLYDHYGIRPLMSIAILSMILVLIFFREIFILSNFLTHILTPSLIKYGNLTLLFFGFFGLRLLGQGIINVFSRNMVMKWFDKHRGLANAILIVLISFGFSASPIFLHAIKIATGWNETWNVLIYILLFFLIFQLLFFRDNPFKAGMAMERNLTTNTKNIIINKTGYTLLQARKTYSFWIFTLSLSMYAIIITAIIFHIESIFKSAGLSPEKAFSIFLPGAVIALFFQFGGSWLSDYRPLIYILLMHIGGMLITLLSLAILPFHEYAVWLLIAGNGIASGTFDVLYTITWPKFFGLKHLGEISGFSMSWIAAGSAIGPFIFAVLFIHNNYLPAIIIFSALLIALGYLAWKAEDIQA